MNRTGDHVCRTCKDGQISKAKHPVWQCLHNVDIYVWVTVYGSTCCGSVWGGVLSLTSRNDSKWQHWFHWLLWGISIQLSSEDHSMTQLCHRTVPTNTHHSDRQVETKLCKDRWTARYTSAVKQKPISLFINLSQVLTKLCCELLMADRKSRNSKLS